MKEFNIPIHIRLRENDLLDSNQKLSDISYNGGYFYNEFNLDEIKENSPIYKYGINLLEENNLLLNENIITYVPNIEWYNIFRIKPRV